MPRLDASGMTNVSTDDMMHATSMAEASHAQPSGIAAAKAARMSMPSGAR